LVSRDDVGMIELPIFTDIPKQNRVVSSNGRYISVPEGA
jgi:hypothetical protein